MQILASGKTGANKYDLKTNDATKVLPRLDMRQLAQCLQYALEATQGYSLSGDEGAAAAINEDLSIIDVSNIADYNADLLKLLQTIVANNSYLEVAAGSTANSIILEPRKIADINSPDGSNYSKTTSLPFAYRDNLTFVFRATATNTDATQVQITGLTGMSGAVDVVDENGNELTGGEIVQNKFYEIVLTGTSGTKKAVLKTISVPNASTTVKGILELLTNAELAAGTDTTRAPTAAAIASLFGESLRSSNGYIRLPVKVGGAFVEIIFQWATGSNTGSIGAQANTTVNITLPVAFPNAVLKSFSDCDGVNSIKTSIVSESTTTIGVNCVSTFGTYSTYPRVFAIGF